jgi:hypothetical protein
MKDLIERFGSDVLDEAKKGKSAKANIDKMMSMMSEISRLAIMTARLPEAKDEERSLQMVIGHLQKAHDVAKKMGRNIK